MKVFFTIIAVLLICALVISSVVNNRVPTLDQTPTLMGALYIFQDYKAVNLEKFINNVTDALLLAESLFVRADDTLTYLGVTGLYVALIEVFWDTFDEVYPENKEAFGAVAGAVGSFFIALFSTIVEVFIIAFDIVRAFLALIVVIPSFLYETWLLIVRLFNYFFGYYAYVPAEQVSPSSTEGARGNLLPSS